MTAPIVALRGVELALDGRPVLTGVDLDLRAGEFVYLVGKTGAGKSTLLRALYGDLPPRAGKARVLNWELAKLNRRSIPQFRRHIGIVFQDHNLLPNLTVAENLDFVLRATGWKKRDRPARITEVLIAVGLPEKTAALPHALSGGERSRIAFARALLNHPKLFIADEVTGNLDPETSRDILTLMRDLAARAGAAVLFATHDYTLLDVFQSRVLECRHGTLTPR